MDASRDAVDADVDVDASRDADVVIVGAGPNGLMLACELGLAGLRPVVLEREPGPGTEAKANGLVGQVVTMMDRRGLYEALAGRARPEPSRFYMFAALPLNLGLLDESPVHTLPVPQPRLVRALAERAAELGADVRYGHALAGLEQDGHGVRADVDGPAGTYRISARYLVGADGGHSTTRKLCGIGFPGVSLDRITRRWGEVSVPGELIDAATGGLDVPGHGLVLPFLGERTERGGFSFAPLPGRPPTIATMEWDRPGPDAPMTLDELRDSVRRVLGADVPIGPPDGDGPHALRRLTGGNNRRAERFRDGRVFLLGDAAHVDPAGGQGLNLGMQDALNLGWKLAADVRGAAPAGLLDSYDAERRPAARRVEMYARAVGALLAPGDDVTGLRELVGELLADAGAVRRVGELIAGTDVRYDMGARDPHPLVGRCAPDLDLHTPDGPVRLAELARTGRPLLIDRTDNGSPTGIVGDRVHAVTAKTTRHDDGLRNVAGSGLAGGGDVTAVLVRPDSYVAWASSSPRPSAAELDELGAAVRRWFGGPG
ncbi:FAD-dependent monooxygenase [Actinomadura sp. WMMB 499]|uniref:FAD-dependent monooxygenase n=1 Tax=Actinomadura sp. WMMB 499 TaxID=1219491 RepID=UPI0012455C26|nr:FAD-dependent monooxygenase [Actinomadura sp. WMMB 499]QFG22719.1 FAD-dependent oxidoreductase [Actinomadura sp. WMMB 499]